MTFTERILAWFPLPQYVSMPAVGMDISDKSVKLIELIPSHHGLRVGRFATHEIPEGVIVGGKIAKRDELVALLSKLREEHGLTFISASLPEEPGYIFTTTVPSVGPEEIRSLLAFKLEEYVPLSPVEAVIDFDIIAGQKGEQKTVAVSVYPQEIAKEYADLLRDAGLTPVSLEIEAQAIARAVVPKDFIGGCLVVDVGAVRSGITVVGGGAVRFTTTVPVGGDSVTAAIKSALPQATITETLAIKNDQGLTYHDDADVKAAFEHLALALKNEVERYYLYWQTRKDAKDPKLPEHPIEMIFLSGGYANVAGLPEYLSRNLRVPTKRADVWKNVCSINDTIPPISYEDSLSYASSIGLALHRDER
ncbi:MAG: type 4 fimbrial biosis protein PilM, type pilus assembly protein PilM [Candidatus Parcubacteria bacterium]|jgi:type IV pilus assembly protein PilM